MYQLIAMGLVVAALVGGGWSIHHSIKKDGIEEGKAAQLKIDQPQIDHLTKTNEVLVSNVQTCETANKTLLADVNSLRSTYASREAEMEKLGRDAERAKAEMAKAVAAAEARRKGLEARIHQLQLLAAMPQTSDKEKACEDATKTLLDLSRWMRDGSGTPAPNRSNPR